MKRKRKQVFHLSTINNYSLSTRRNIYDIVIEIITRKKKEKKRRRIVNIRESN